MDYGLLIIFLCAGIWLYGAVLLALGDWRWNLGRVIQYALCGAFAAWIVVTHRYEARPACIPVVVLLLTVTLFLPLFIQRRIHHRLLKGNLRAARRWELAWSLILWRPRSAMFPAIEAIYAAAAERGGAAFTEIAPGGHWLERLTAGLSRKVFIESQIYAWTALGEYRAAVGLFESHFAPGGMPPDAGLLYTMVISYGEADDLRKAVRCLRRAEEMNDEPNPLDMRRFVAYLNAYAQSGRIYAMERLLDRNGAAADALPTAYIRLWRGVALLRHGEPEAGRDVLVSAVARQREGETWLGRIAAPYLALPPGRAARAELEPDVAADLDAVESLEERAPLAAVHVLLPSAAWRPFLSWGLMTLCLAAWLVTEALGSSEDAFNLSRLGANVPGMVKTGEWWRLVSSIFLHGGPLHLFFNMYALYLFGPFVERLAGRWQTFVVFMVAGIAGSATSCWLGNPGLSVGASGAIFGLLGAATVIGLTFQGIPPHVRKVYLFNFIFIAVLQLAYGLVETHVDNFAHAGGLGAGVLVGLCLRPAGIEGRWKAAFRTAGMVLALALAASFISVVHSAWNGGYPKAISAWQTASGPKGDWSISVPASWQVGKLKTPVKDKETYEVVYLDPLGAELTFTATSRRLIVGPEPGENKMEARRREIGRYTYEEIHFLKQPQDGETLERRVYVTSNADRNYELMFLCDHKDVARYEELITLILHGLEVREPAPGGNRPPRTPFAPGGPVA